MEKNFEIDQKTFDSRRIHINDAKKKFNKLKREQKSIGNDNEEELIGDKA